MAPLPQSLHGGPTRATATGDASAVSSSEQHHRLAKHLEPYVSMYAIVYRDPNGTPDNEHDDWYSCITDRVPARDFVTFVKNSASMVDTGSINRIRAKRTHKAAAAVAAAAAASAAPQGSNSSWGGILRTFFTVITSFGRGGGSSAATSSTTAAPVAAAAVDDDRAYYAGCLGSSGKSQLSANLPSISHYDPVKDVHIHILCAIDTCITFRVVKDEDGDESTYAYANIVAIIRSFYEAQVTVVKKQSNKRAAAVAAAAAAAAAAVDSDEEDTDSD